MIIQNNECKVKNCSGKPFTYSNGEKRYVKGYCSAHYMQIRKNGKIVRTTIRNRSVANKLQDMDDDKLIVYKTYHEMVRRCTNIRCKDYVHYGARGISISDEWLGDNGFNRFYDHIGKRPSSSHSIDRIDNNLGYIPGNVRWATKQVQSINRGTSKNNTTGYRGISYNKKTKLYVAQLMVSGKIVLCKSTKDLLEAVNARKIAEDIYFRPILNTR